MLDGTAFLNWVSCGQQKDMLECCLECESETVTGRVTRVLSRGCSYPLKLLHPRERALHERSSIYTLKLLRAPQARTSRARPPQVEQSCSIYPLKLLRPRKRSRVAVWPSNRHKLAPR